MKIKFDTPPEAGQDPSGLQVRYAASKRQVPRWRWYLLLALVLAPPTYLLLRFAAGFLWAQVPAVVVLEHVVLRAPFDAWVMDTPATTGQLLSTGAPVLKLVNPSNGAPAVHERAPAAEVANVQADPYGEMLHRAVTLAQRQLALRHERLLVMERLRAHSAATRPETEAARFQWLQAEAELDRARSDLDAHLEHRRRQATPPGSHNASANDANVPAHAVSATFDARVAQIFVHEGEWVAAGTELAVLQSTAPAIVHAYVHPGDLHHAQVGAQAVLRFFDGGRVRATVTEVAAQVERLPAERVSPLSPRTPSVVARLQPTEPLPDRYQVHALPLDVRFVWRW